MFNKTFESVENWFGQYGDYSFTDDVTNKSDGKIQRLTKIRLDYNPEIIDIIFNLELIDNKFWIVFVASCGEKEVNVKLESVSSDNIVESLENVCKMYEAFMAGIYREKVEEGKSESRNDIMDRQE